MTYDRIHKFLLRSIASRGVIAMPEVKQIINSFTEDVDVSPKDLIKDINEKIRPFQQKIKITNDELTSEEVVVFLSLGYDDATKSQNIFSATELEYFRILLEQIMTTVTRQITGIHAINLVSSMKSSFTKTDAQKLLNVWCQMRYLDKDDANYALGVRAIHEFEGYFRENMPDIIEECCLCKQVVFRGCNCPACGVAIHTLCLNKYLEKLQKWPCCMIDFNQAQLDRLNCIGLSQSVRLRETQETICDETEPLTCSSMDVDDGTQEIIPEISQRITRKRKRPE
ncbi:PREDICTED: non-structural maintenance of chromosomes element 1 homolog [Papilio xuthus]|uniref:Non-structural maintenance of chromosomes element 1 homolog n=1 Tax=Papilio xuthus TaxID=66420 RepID=A0AAJ7EEH8_PAPXU|nr:PREDICTED: non-structural maintenance of chromosomes element 1 homolog [Papilio xuthus]